MPGGISDCGSHEAKYEALAIFYIWEYGTAYQLF